MSETKRTVKIDDLSQLKFVGTPTLSPDGQNVAYTVTKTNLDQNGYESSIWIAEQGEKPKQLTRFFNEEKLIKDHQPVWSVDGQTLYFLSNRTEKQQVWRLSLLGGEAEQLTNFADDVSHFRLSHANEKLVCTVSQNVKDPVEEDNEDVVIVERLRYIANGSGFVKTYTHLHLFDLESKTSSRLTDGCFNAMTPWFTPDDHSILFLKSRENPENHGYFHDLYQLNLETKEEILIYKGKGTLFGPTLSPDGKWIAFCGQEGGEISAKNIGIWILPSDNSEAPRNITSNWDRPVGNYVGVDASFDNGNALYKWSNNSESLVFLATDGGDTVLKKVNLQSEMTDYLVEPKTVITSFDYKDDKCAFIKATPLSPGDVYLKTNDCMVQLSHHNEEIFNELDLSVPQSFSYKGADNWEIEGWILYPPSTVKTEGKIPVVVEIHGGPHTAYGNAFHHEFQCLAAEGYAVVYTNPRGSQGYGEAFTAACVGDWGNKDREDILMGLDYALENDSNLDRNNLYVTGGSYGGFMTNTIITHTNRFKAAVTQRCISNMYSFFGTSDIGYFFGEGQLGDVDLWDDEDAIMEVSPIRHARNVKTPTCIIHAEEDLRCPMEQAEQWYVALRRLGVETRFVRFKGETHELSRSGKPKNRLTRLREIIGWFNKYNQ